MWTQGSHHPAGHPQLRLIFGSWLQMLEVHSSHHPGAPSKGSVFILLPQILVWAALELLPKPSPSSEC